MEQSNPNVLVQNVRDFTVQIRHAETEKIVGTGFVVSMQGHVVTCKHVVKEAGVDPRSRKRIQGFWARQWERLFHSSKDADGVLLGEGGCGGGAGGD